MWPFSRRTRQRDEQVIYQINKPSHGEILRGLRSDRERSARCAFWAEEARQDWFRRQREVTMSIVLSESPRYKNYSPEARRLIGRQQWIRSQEQKDLAADEQMFRQWADHYKSQADSQGEPPLHGKVTDPLGVF